MKQDRRLKIAILRGWSDPQQDGFFAPYFRLIDAENVTFNRRVANVQVFEILRDSDFSILATFSDSSALALWNPSPWELP
jgi:hypothetical protein